MRLSTALTAVLTSAMVSAMTLGPSSATPSQAAASTSSPGPAGPSAPAPPAPGSGTGRKCIDKLTYSEAGLTRPVPPGTNCQDSNGDIIFVHAGVGASEASVTGGSAPAAPAPANSVSATVPGAVPNASGSAAPPAISAGQLALGVSPPGVATCPAGKVEVTATAPKPDGKKKFVAYWSVWHGTGKGELPDATQLKGVTHLILSFWDPDTMNTFKPSSNTDWSTSTADQLRQIQPGLKVMAAFGGWALDEFFRFNATDQYRDALAQVFVDFALKYKLDGIDVDWEYPVNFGATYETTRPESPCDKMNNVLLMQAIRNKLDAAKGKPGAMSEYILSLAVPAKPGDVKAAYDSESVPLIDKVVDFWNVMSYDFMNRRDDTLKHHAGLEVIQNSVALYHGLGIPNEKIMAGFPMYAKFFKLPTTANCDPAKAIGCVVGPNAFEGAGGADLATSGAIMFNDKHNSAEALGTIDYPKFKPAFDAFKTVRTAGKTDDAAGATWALDKGIFYTWLTGNDTAKSCAAVIKTVGGVMVWSIDQDNLGRSGGDRFSALADCMSQAGSGNTTSAS